MDDLITFLRAQLDDDERVAREAAGAPWSADIPGAVHVGAADRAENRAWRQLGHVAHVEHEADRQHIARWDPARVLAEVEAKRRILALHGESDVCDAHNAAYETIPCDTLLALAQPYAGRPGWRAEWAA